MLNYIETKALEEEKNIIFLLHGYGDDAHGLGSLIPFINKELSNTTFISINAPFECEQGMGKQWFSLVGYDPESLKSTPTITEEFKEVFVNGLKHGSEELYQTIKTISADRGISFNKIGLLGFSQGCMVSLYSAVNMDEQLGAVCGFSGCFELFDDEFDTFQAVSKPPIYVFHGAEDNVVPVEAGKRAHLNLKCSGIDAQLHIEKGVPHSIGGESLSLAVQFYLDNLYET